MKRAIVLVAVLAGCAGTPPEPQTAGAALAQLQEMGENRRKQALCDHYIEQSHVMRGGSLKIKVQDPVTGKIWTCRY